ELLLRALHTGTRGRTDRRRVLSLFSAMVTHLLLALRGGRDELHRRIGRHSRGKRQRGTRRALGRYTENPPAARRGHGTRRGGGRGGPGRKDRRRPRGGRRR